MKFIPVEYQSGLWHIYAYDPNQEGGTIKATRVDGLYDEPCVIYTSRESALKRIEQGGWKAKET